MKIFKINTMLAISASAMLAVVLSSCNKTESGSNKNGESVIVSSATYYSVRSVDHYADGVHYKVFISENGGVFVINATKDSLEVVKNKH